MRKTLDRQAAVSRMKVSFKKKQIEQVIVDYANDGKYGPYNELLNLLKDKQISDRNFKILFEDCLSCVVYFKNDWKLFVELLCGIEWINRGPELVDVYSKFIINLVVTHTYHCQKVMTALVNLFKDEGEKWDDQPSDDQLRQWSHIHSLIAQIVSLIPMSSNILMPTVMENFPYYKAGSYANRAYIHNLIWITRYIPALKEQIMYTIIHRMIEMDVNIVDGKDKTAQKIDNANEETSETLDYCMLEVLKWLEDERETVLLIFCNVFERIILRTYGIRYVQFLLLYTISINQQCADRIFTNLWTITAGIHGVGPGALTTRKTAISHLAGLLARCKRIPNSRLVHYLKTMSDWCHGYIIATQETSSHDNTKVHSVFHAVCHAIFYLVAFKHNHLFRNKEGFNFIESLNLARLVTCPLNPLRTCPPQVTRAFSSVTRSHQVVYCQAIIEKNARYSIHNSVEYDEWFPYDPYTLPKSGKTIWPLCIEYSDWLKEGDDDTQYSSRKRKLDEDDDFLQVAPTPRQRLSSSLSNCITPGFKSSETIVM
ncbi:unnamed protein product [Leptosia nina]|uniref:RNA polymerase I-specific transcription initiation factor RRN3 n=1 Tax=Leptosia nina TaxID=320188 RepID=A0AAV1J9P0_9NEOP